MLKFRKLLENYFTPAADRVKLCINHLERNHIEVCYPNDKKDGIEIAPYFSSFSSFFDNLSYTNYCLNELYNHNITACSTNIKLSHYYKIPNIPHLTDDIARFPDCKYVIDDYADDRHPLNFKNFNGITLDNLEISLYNNSLSTGINFAADTGLTYPGEFLLCLENFSEPLNASNFLFNTDNHGEL